MEAVKITWNATSGCPARTGSAKLKEVSAIALSDRVCASQSIDKNMRGNHIAESTSGHPPHATNQPESANVRPEIRAPAFEEPSRLTNIAIVTAMMAVRAIAIAARANAGGLRIAQNQFKG